MNKKILWFLIVVLLVSSCAAPTAAPTADLPQTATQQEAAVTSTVVPPTSTPAPTDTPVPTSTPAPTDTPTAIPSPTPANIADVIAYEMKGSFDFFWQQANTDPASPGFGLVRDRYPGSEGIASMASVGFALSAYPIGIEKGYITLQEGYDRANGTMDTLLKMDRVEGFYFHFVDMKTAKRAWESEVSSIDSSILLMGVLTAGEYFGGDVQTKAKQIFDAVNWPWFLDKDKNMFYMAYRPGKGFEGYWDFYAEQLMLYVMAAGSDTYPVGFLPYYTFTRHTAKYGEGQPFIHSWFGSIFTHQFSHAWIDFRGYTDKKDVNWFDNSLAAVQAQYDYAVKMQPKYKTLGPLAWGLSASDGPDGYNGLYGGPPSGFDNKQHKVDDTIPPYGAVASIIFLPEQAQQAMLNYYSLEKLKGPYGFKDAYNLSRNWYASDVIGIDKGVSLLMLANYESDFVYSIVMKNATILQGLERLELQAKK